MNLQETGGGAKDLISFILRMALYKKFKNKKLHFLALEIDEKELKRKIQNQYTKEYYNENNQTR